MNPADRPSGARGGQPPNPNAAQANEAPAQEPGRNRRARETGDTADDRNVRQRRDGTQPVAEAQARIFAEAAAHQVSGAGPSRAPAAAARQVPQAPPSSPQVNHLVSIQDGRVGSVYFDDSRVRLIHSRGPRKSQQRPPQHIERFNIDNAIAGRAFLASGHPSLRQVFALATPGQTFNAQSDAIKDAFFAARDRWLGETLHAATDLPFWAQRVQAPEDVQPASQVPANSRLVMFEIYADANGDIDTTHVSRGEGAQMPLGASALNAIEAGLRAIEGVTDPNLRNQLLYATLQDHAPDFANQVRTP